MRLLPPITAALAGIAAYFLFCPSSRAEERQIGEMRLESPTLVRQLQAIKAAPFTFHYSLTLFVDGMNTRRLDAELEMTIPGKIEADANTGSVSATVQFKQQGKGEPALPQSFILRFAPDGYYTDAPDKIIGIIQPLMDACFPNFLDAKKYPDAALRDGMKKGAMIAVLDLGGAFRSLLGPLRLNDIDGEWAKCEARPAWEGAPPSQPLPDMLWEKIKIRSDSPTLLGKYVISIKTLLPRSADLTMDLVKPQDGQKSQVFHLKIDPVK